MSFVKMSEKVFWIGKVDDRKVPFHRLILERGTTYNSYLLLTDKPTVIDTVDLMYGKEYMDNLTKLIDPEEIQYIVINHVEPDHAGALPALAAKAKNAKIVSTELGATILKDMFKLHHREFITIADGDTLDIGGEVLKFFETPYLHTEETMITYSMEEGVLFPCDLFSTHIAAFDLFNDLVEEADYLEDFKVYYNLIMSPHRPYIRDMLNKIKDLDIKAIAPSHGYILRKDPGKFINIYDEMSRLNPSDKKVVIAYSTMTGNTTKIAQQISEGLKTAGVESEIINLKNADLEEVKAKILESDGLLVGSSTKYGDMVGTVEELLKSLKDANVKGKLAAAFGSYGWSGEAIMYVEDYLNEAGFKVINQKYMIAGQGMDTLLLPLRIKFAKDEGLELANTAGRIFGEQILVNS
ncbi:MAG: flavodoxin/nitric oxide synthase [Herbinix sp.]|jgi:flavorubredoxin|nr:flavodoxin/nitric oxide synthase [Herbinix sp.]